MITNWINITRVTIQGAERLYPNGLDWNLAPGINAVIGGTSLGKTTLVCALQFAVFGKLVSDSAERIERDFFKDRLTNRSGKMLEKSPPLIRVEFTTGSSTFAVQRNLISGVLVEATCDGTAVRANKYESLMAEKVGIKDDFESMARLQSHLFFFGENRFLLAWENRLQHELLNLMMSDHATYRQLDELWAKVESADSAARNISAQASRMEKDIKNLTQRESKVKELQQRSDTRQRNELIAEMEMRVAVIRKKIAKDEELEVAQSKEIAQVFAEFHRELAELEDAQSSDLDDSLLAAAFANPTVASVRRSLEEFYRAPSARGCPCCGRVGIAETISRFVENAAASVNAGKCVVCCKPLPGIDSGSKMASPPQTKGANTKAHSLQNLLFLREQTKSRISELRTDEVRALQALAENSEA